jgi:predicted outer membrane repeat protein
MEWPSVILKILIVMSSLLFLAKISYSMTVNYVKPFSSERASPCSDMQRPCLALNEYASNSDEYFVNNTRFYFYPGIHRLDNSLILIYLYNFSFLGRPSGGQTVTIAVDSSATITWNETWNIEISSIKFALHDNFTFIMRFEHSQLVRLSNISIYGNGYSGCSSIISEESVLEFNDSTFIGINGFLGAALMMFASNTTFRGSIVFADNTATSGGSIYLTHNSTLILNGTGLIRNNTSSQEIMNRKMLSCNNIDPMREIKLSLLNNGSGGAIVGNNSYLEIYYYSNFTQNNAEWHGGAVMLNTCSLNVQGNASFVGNTALHYGGAMLLQNTNSSVNGNFFLNKNLAQRGGALSIIDGIFIINGYILFHNNYASYEGGALYISSHANFKYCGSVYSGSSNASFDAGARPLNKTEAFDAECSTDNALSFNTSITFLLNTAKFLGGSITCENASTVTFFGIVYFNESYDNAIEVDRCNMTFIGTTYFYRNSGSYAGGAILGSDSKILFSGTAHFEGNVANYVGGAIALEASKLIFKPNLNIFFILNHAKKGGVLYIRDFQCSLRSSAPIECFITIDSPSISTRNILLHFENNSAGTTGSILYGGHLDECRLYFKSITTKESDLCGCQAHGYSDNALETFMNISNITQSENKNHIPNLSSFAKEIKFCEGRTAEQSLLLYPGQQFTIPLIALGQANSSVSTTVFWETKYNYTYPRQRGEYRLSLPNNTIDDICTDVSFWLYTSDLNLQLGYLLDLDFKLYPLNPCQNLAEGLILRISVHPCPVGFDLSQADSKCVCATALKQLGIQNCYIDSKSGSVE